MKKVEIYSTPTCTYCRQAKEYFTANNVAYVEYNVATDLARRQEMLEKTGQMGVPVIAVDGEYSVGYNKELLQKQLGL